MHLFSHLVFFVFKLKPNHINQTENEFKIECENKQRKIKYIILHSRVQLYVCILLPLRRPRGVYVCMGDSVEYLVNKTVLFIIIILLNKNNNLVFLSFSIFRLLSFICLFAIISITLGVCLCVCVYINFEDAAQ